MENEVVKRHNRLKKEIEEVENNRTKLMWQYANWEQKIILILGYLSLGYLFYKFVQYFSGF